MKADWKRRLAAAVLGALGALGSIGAFASGMRLADAATMETLLPVCLGAAVLGALLGERKWFWLLPLSGLGLCLVWSKRLGLDRSLEALVYFVSKLYDMGYNWGTLRWSGETLVTTQAGPVLWIWGALTALTVARGSLRGNTVSGVAAAMLGLVPCMVLTDTVPQEKYLFLQLLCVAVLLLSGREARRSFWLGVPAFLAVAALFFAMPKEDYNGQALAEKMGEQLESLFTLELPESTQAQPILPERPDTGGGNVNLSLVGPKNSWKIPVLDVTAQETGTMYLRGESYAHYGGTWWGEDREDWDFPIFSTGTDEKTLHVTTRQSHSVLYVPYGTMEIPGTALRDNSLWGCVGNPDGRKDYTAVYTPVDFSQVGRYEQMNQYFLSTPEGMPAGDTVPQEGTVYTLSGPHQRYLQLDEDTRRRAEALLERELPQLESMESHWQKAQAIRNYVSGSAAYSLMAKRMPSDEDFALWFLESAETGYCVHFASAATVLLRAAGIPARYVTGYLASARANETVTVTQSNAHAWTEVYIRGAGWVLLEATPAGGVDSTANPEAATDPSGPEETEPEQSQQTQPSQPEETEKPTLPEESRETTPQSGADKPSKPQAPRRMPGWAKALLWLLATLGTIVAQWRLRTALRRQKRHRGSTNDRVLAMWRESELCCRLLKKPPEEEFLTLAQKARFSQYTLTREERNRCSWLLQEEKQQLKLQRNLRTVIGALIFALY